MELKTESQDSTNHPSEKREKALECINLLDSSPEEQFDRHTRLLKFTSQADFVGLALHGKQQCHLKSHQGLDHTAPASYSALCLDIISSDRKHIARNSDGAPQCGHCSSKFTDFAGLPVHGNNGECLGCVFIANHNHIRFKNDEIDSLHHAAGLIEKDIDWLQQSTIDRLTGIHNQQGFSDAAPQALAACKRNDIDATLISFDLDQIGNINDTLGREGGDLALVAFANLLHASLDLTDIVARLYGSHFIALITHDGDCSLTTKIETLRANIRTFNQNSEICANLVTPNTRLVHYDQDQHCDVQSMIDALNTGFSLAIDPAD